MNLRKRHLHWRNGKLRNEVKVAWIFLIFLRLKSICVLYFFSQKIINIYFPFIFDTIWSKYLTFTKFYNSLRSLHFIFHFCLLCLNEKQFSSLSSHPFLLSMTAYETPISSASPITLSTIFCAPPRVCFTLVHSYTLTHKK